MKLIGKGYWYNVFDLGNERVLKLEKGFQQKVKDSYSIEGKKLFTWLITVFKLLTGRKKITESYSYMQKHVNPALLGQPRFLNGISYEQDKVELLDIALSQASSEEKQKLINLYIQNILNCWRNGFADRVYNFTINNGLTNNGQLILLDFNEVTFSKSKILQCIWSKRWLRAWSFRQIDQKLQEYYQMQMDNLVTQKTLEENWEQDKK